MMNKKAGWDTKQVEVFLLLHTEDFRRDYQNLLEKRIKIVREPSVEIYGTVAVFEDLYGNLWD